MANQSVSILDHQMDMAIARSEFKRIQIFIAALLIGLGIMSFNFFLVDGTTDFFKNSTTKYYVIGWFVVFIAYEVFGFFMAKTFLKRNIVVPKSMKMANVTIEAMLPGFLLYLLCFQEKSVIFLDSPLLFFYFILIALSALNLETRLSLIIGLVSAGSYLLVTRWAIDNYDPQHQVLHFPPVLYYARSLFMFLAAMGSTFVAHEIKRRFLTSFNLRKERDEIGRHFDQQVSKEVAEALMKDDFSSRKGHVTIMFLDIRNYSSYAERNAPEQVINFQNQFFSPILRTVQQHKGITNQILGDGLMATFGAPLEDELHPQHAFEAANAIFQKIDDLIKRKVIPSIKIGIGLHTGEVVMGNIGNELRKQFSISGTAVVIAARIEQANKEHSSEFLLSATTHELLDVSDQLPKSIGKIKMKNISDEIEVYKVR